MYVCIYIYIYIYIYTHTPNHSAVLGDVTEERPQRGHLRGQRELP